jgi:hypothetical protein
MLTYVSCQYWRVIGCLDKDDPVDWNKSVQGRVFVRVYVENILQVPAIYLKF